MICPSNRNVRFDFSIFTSKLVSHLETSWIWLKISEIAMLDAHETRVDLRMLGECVAMLTT